MKLRRKQQRAIEWALTTGTTIPCLRLVSGSPTLAADRLCQVAAGNPLVPWFFSDSKKQAGAEAPAVFLNWGRVVFTGSACGAGRQPSPRMPEPNSMNAAGLRSRCGVAVDREGFPAGSTIALRDTTYREGARRGTVV